jgi:hypothetical protein
MEAEHDARGGDARGHDQHGRGQQRERQGEHGADGEGVQGMSRREGVSVRREVAERLHVVPTSGREVTGPGAPDPLLQHDLQDVGDARGDRGRGEDAVTVGAA